MKKLDKLSYDQLVDLKTICNYTKTTTSEKMLRIHSEFKVWLSDSTITKIKHGHYPWLDKLIESKKPKENKVLADVKTYNHTVKTLENILEVLQRIELVLISNSITSKHFIK